MDPLHALCGDCLKAVREAREAPAADPLKDYMTGYGAKGGWSFPQADRGPTPEAKADASPEPAERTAPKATGQGTKAAPKAAAGKDGVDWVKVGAVGAVAVVGGIAWAWWEGLFD